MPTPYPKNPSHHHCRLYDPWPIVLWQEFATPNNTVVRLVVPVVGKQNKLDKLIQFQLTAHHSHNVGDCNRIDIEFLTVKSCWLQATQCLTSPDWRTSQ